MARIAPRLAFWGNARVIGVRLMVQWFPIDLGLPTTGPQLTTSDAVEIRVGAK